MFKLHPKSASSQSQTVDESKIHTMQDDLADVGGGVLEQMPLQQGVEKQTIPVGSEVVFNELPDASFSNLPPAEVFQSKLPKQKLDLNLSQKAVQRMPVSDMGGFSVKDQPKTQAFFQQDQESFPNTKNAYLSNSVEQKTSNVASLDFGKQDKLSMEGVEFQPALQNSDKKSEGNDIKISKERVAVGGARKNQSLYALLTVFVLLCVGAAGAYYWMMQRDSEGVYVIEDDGKVTGGNIEESPDYTTVAVNTLLINNDGSDIREVISEAVTKVEGLFQGDVLQFVFARKDDPAKPLAMQEVISLLNLQLGQDLSNQMNDGVTWFLYNDVDGVKAGFSAKVLSVEVTKKLLEVEEHLLSHELQSVFIQSITPVEAIFNSSIYKTYSIRYLNLDSLQSQSIDYTFRNDSLILGTSKMATRAILDKLDQSNAQSQESSQSQMMKQDQINTSK